MDVLTNWDDLLHGTIVFAALVPLLAAGFVAWFWPERLWLALACGVGGAMAWLRDVTGPSVARAHGGTDPLNGRRVRAEWLSQVAFDVLSADPRHLGTVDAETGPVATAAITFDPFFSKAVTSFSTGNIQSRASPTCLPLIQSFKRLSQVA